MNMDDPITRLIENPYMRFNAVAKTMYSDESAIASCTATLFIRYSDLCKNNPAFNALIKTLDEQAKKKAEEPISMNPLKRFVWDIYEPLFKAYPRAKDYLDAKLENVTWENIGKFNDDLNEWLFRNNISIRWNCTVETMDDTEE